MPDGTISFRSQSLYSAKNILIPYSLFGFLAVTGITPPLVLSRKCIRLYPAASVSDWSITPQRESEGIRYEAWWLPRDSIFRLAQYARPASLALARIK